jgi:hypothetical protein
MIPAPSPSHVIHQRGLRVRRDPGNHRKDAVHLRIGAEQSDEGLRGPAIARITKIIAPAPRTANADQYGAIIVNVAWLLA